jgi:ABC-type dipeptide/oligopeptide/nickel transport system permease subunit
MKPPTPSWGAMLRDAIQFYEFDPTYMVVPGVAIFITVLAFNLFGDGLRDALDPRAGR